MGCNCTKVPPPEEYKSAVGTWNGTNSDNATVTFVLYPDGSFFWGRKTGNTSVSKQGPINRWSGNTFDSRPCCCCSWHFEIQKPMNEADGMSMEVNGVKVTYAGVPQVFNNN